VPVYLLQGDAGDDELSTPPRDPPSPAPTTAPNRTTPAHNHTPPPSVAAHSPVPVSNPLPGLPSEGPKAGAASLPIASGPSTTDAVAPAVGDGAGDASADGSGECAAAGTTRVASGAVATGAVAGLPHFSQVVHVFQDPLQHLAEFERLCTYLRRAYAFCSLSTGVCPTYNGIFDRFCLKFSQDLARDCSRLQCVALYSSVCESLQTGAHYTVLQAIESYLQE
jgi:hypothetical protein